MHDEDFEGKRRVPVGGDHVSKLAAVIATPLRTVSLEKIILIDVAVGCRVALDAAYGIRTRHARIIEG